MKRRPGRELVWMTVPVFLLGGVGLWLARGGNRPTVIVPPSDLMRGPTRLEFGPWRDAFLSPSEVARGYLVKKKLTVWQGGLPPVPSSVRRVAHAANAVDNVRLAFRRGVRWQIFNPPSGYAAMIYERQLTELNSFAVQRDMECKINLNGVPRDAEEVRLRGDFIYINAYQGASCGAISPDPRWKLYGKVCQFTTRSNPFDLLVKAPGKAWPAPLVEREPKVEVLGAARFQGQGSISLVIHLRHREKSNWELDSQPSAWRMHLLDGNHKEVALFDNNGAGDEKHFNYFGTVNQRLFYPNKPLNEIMVPIASSEYAPKNGWDSVKRPLWLEGQVDDGECWPTPFKMRIEERSDDPKNYGAPQK